MPSYNHAIILSGLAPPPHKTVDIVIAITEGIVCVRGTQRHQVRKTRASMFEGYRTTKQAERLTHAHLPATGCHRVKTPSALNSTASINRQFFLQDSFTSQVAIQASLPPTATPLWLLAGLSSCCGPRQHPRSRQRCLQVCRGRQQGRLLAHTAGVPQLTAGGHAVIALAHTDGAHLAYRRRGYRGGDKRWRLNHPDAKCESK